MRREKVTTRREHLRQSVALSLGAASLLLSERAGAESAGTSLIAKPPSTFFPWSRPGLVVKAEAKGSFSEMMQPNLLWPKPEVARRLVERALTDLTGASNLVSAMARFVHPLDTVAIKVNGIAGQLGHTVATNYEVILPVVEAILATGVPASRVTIYEQYPAYLAGCRVGLRRYPLPEGVITHTHNNQIATMEPLKVYRNIETRYCSALTNATAVIAITMMKDHSICGFTGALKNVTHGSILNPHDHHAHQASPQIAMLYKHPIVTSRVRLHLTDAFKVIFDKGPLDKDPRTRAAHGAIYASTDPVALDRVGSQVIDAERTKRGGATLEKSGRPPLYIEQSADLGLGVFRDSAIALRSVTI